MVSVCEYFDNEWRELTTLSWVCCVPGLKPSDWTADRWLDKQLENMMLSTQCCWKRL